MPASLPPMITSRFGPTAGLMLGRAAEQLLDAAADLVTDGPDRVDALAGGVVEDPVLVPFARVEGAGVAAAHGDHHIRFADRCVGEDLGCSAAMSIPTSSIACTAAGLT